MCGCNPRLRRESSPISLPATLTRHVFDSSLPLCRSTPQLRKLEQPVDMEGKPWPLDAAGNPIVK